MIPTFTDFNEIEQCNELRVYFAGLGANIKTEVSYRENEHLQKSLEDLISVLHICIEKEQSNDVEIVLNSIVSLLIQVPHTQTYCQKLISMFCSKICESVNEKTSMVCLRVLQNLFEGLGVNNSLKYDVYLSLIEIAGNFDKLNLIFDELPKLSQWFNSQTVGIEKLQKLYRLLHKALLQNNQGEQASKVMIELLGTYTEENAANAREDANKCIVSFISDPGTFLMDHLLSLKPVRILEGEPIHDLLNIFVSDKLNEYIAFYNKNKSFIESLGLSHENNLQKMRLLTFMQIAEKTKEIKFESIESELQLKPEEVEAFIVDVLRTRLVKAKVDQVNRKVFVSSTMHRTFGKPQWNMLRSILSKWKDNMDNVNSTLGQAIRNSSSLQVPV